MGGQRGLNMLTKWVDHFGPVNYYLPSLLLAGLQMLNWWGFLQPVLIASQVFPGLLPPTDTYSAREPELSFHWLVVLALSLDAQSAAPFYLRTTAPLIDNYFAGPLPRLAPTPTLDKGLHDITPPDLQTLRHF